MTRTRSSLWLSLPLIALVITAAPPMASPAKPKPPEMKLRVSTHHGYLPLDLTLEGFIASKEIPLSEFESCLLTVEWNYRTPARQDLASKEELPCTVAGENAGVTDAFKKNVILYEPGIYSYRIVLVGKDGRRYAGTSQEVKVIKSPVEVGVVGNQTDNR